MKLSIAIVEDQTLDTEDLFRDIRLWDAKSGGDNLNFITCYSNGENMLSNFLPGMFQLVFMDIYMDNLNGIETAKSLRSFDKNILIVFLTTSEDFVFQAFPIHCFDYIVKPYTFERLSGVLNEALNFISTYEEEITVNAFHTQYKIPLSKISAVLSHGHNTEIVFIDGKNILTNMSFGDVENLLTDKRFLLCNRGIIINMDYVSSVDYDIFKMKNGFEYPIKVRKRSQIASAFLQYQISRIKGEIASE